MVEIFTVLSGQKEAPARTVANEVKLSRPSDVYFGSGDAGIAFYEKSGADLRVTLLDGQEVLVRDFFVIGAGGEYSRLLDGGAGGGIEVTGLIAPEPFVPPEINPATTVAAVEEIKADEAPISQGSDEEVIVEVAPDAEAGGDAATEVAARPVGSADAEVGTFGGVPMDRILFGAAFAPTMVTLLRKNDNEEAPPPPAPVMAKEGQPVDETGQDGTDQPAMDPELAALLADGDDGTLDSLFQTADAPADLAADGPAEDFALFDMSAVSSLLDALNPIPTEG